MVLGQGEWLVSGEEKKILRLPLFFVLTLPPIFKIPYTWAKILFGPPNWSLNFFFFVTFDFSCFFVFL